MARHVSIPDRDPLQDPLMFLAGGAIIPLCKVALFDAFWGDAGPLRHRIPPSANTYFEYLESQCRAALSKWEKYDLSELKFSHVTDIAKMLKAGSTRPDIEQFLGDVLVGDCRIIASEIIDLTVRLVLMVPIWSFWQGVSPKELALTWVEGTVERSFERHFRPKQKLLSEKRMEYGVKQPIVMDKTFTAQRLDELAGIKVMWTNNLLDHLKMTPDNGGVFLFHHAAVLTYQRDNRIYPAGLISETLRTLALLLPRSDKETRDWFVQQQAMHHLDPEAGNCRPLSRDDRNIENFVFWKEHLTSLKMAFDEAKPVQPKSLLRRYFSAINLKS
ncbi:hypothetical protein K3495_g7422 [Podosphaera aphanis]|nr:hypothetical protein K3495_g7422 [Podosphaera aphanis]